MKEPTAEAFAIVPHRLTAHPNLEPSVKVMLTHCLEKFQTKTDNGQPWTFSVPGIARGTGLNERTVRRHIKIIRKQRVLKLYGSRMNGKKRYDVFIFVRAMLDAMLSAADKMPVVIPAPGNGVDELAETTADRTADKLTDKVPPKRKMVEGRLKKEDENTNQGNGSQPPVSRVAPVTIQGAGTALTLDEKIKARFCLP